MNGWGSGDQEGAPASMAVNYLPEFVFAALAVTYTLYLALVRINQAKHESVMNRHKPGTSGYETYRKIYSTQYLAVWVLITLFFLFNLSFSVIRSASHISPLALYAGLVASIMLSMTGLYTLSALFRKDKKK